MTDNAKGTAEPVIRGQGMTLEMDIIVACKCGWHGPQSELITRPASQSVIVGEKLCPECSAVFSPARRPNP